MLCPAGGCVSLCGTPLGGRGGEGHLALQLFGKLLGLQLQKGVVPVEEADQPHVGLCTPATSPTSAAEALRTWVRHLRPAVHGARSRTPPAQALAPSPEALPPSRRTLTARWLGRPQLAALQLGGRPQAHW